MKINSNKNWFLVMTLILTLIFCSGAFAFAANQSQLQGQLDDVESEQNKVSAQLAKTEKEVKALQGKVNGLNYQINMTIEDIAETEERIEKKQAEMQEREENLNERLVVMYKNGSVGFIDILLGSNSISEFISNMEIIQKIYENDMDVLTTLEKEYDELEVIKAELKEKKASLASQKEAAAAEKVTLDAKKKELEKKEDELKAQADQLVAEIRALINKNSPYVGGQLAWPVPSSTYISSSFGNRLHPIFKVWKFHTGIDIGASSGKDILAAGNGKVIMSKWYGGYGNCVMIDHGGGIVTLYGHCSKNLVSVGQTVKRGQVIAKVGSTGNSTGPHLHFEVREDGEYKNPLNYVK